MPKCCRPEGFPDFPYAGIIRSNALLLQMTRNLSQSLNIPKYTLVNSDMMSVTTVKIHETTKHQIDLFREYKNESYDEVIQKIVFIAKNLEKDPELSRETIKAIEKARERIKKGRFLTEKQAAKRLGL